ncbi:MAG: penicillin-binding protein 2 [Acidobacteriota bacterium]|nr:penicillin-binding protein 2 [Acidobacteriota bacterium]
MMEVREQRDELLRRLPVLRVAIVTALVAIGSCYWFVQVVRGTYYREMAENNRLRKAAIKAPRGLIHDREGRLLVDNVPSYGLFLDRSRTSDLGRSVGFAAGILQRDREELLETLDRYRSASWFTPVLLAENLSLSEVAKFSVRALESPEFEIQVDHLRLYRQGALTAHVLGYLGEVTDNDVRDSSGRLQVGDLVGRRGVEKSFDETLRGIDGERVVVVDSRGRPREEHGRQTADAGHDRRLTLDLEMQQIAARYFQDRVGAAIALDPRNGEILVLVSSPSYDPNLFARRLAQAEWRRIVEAPHNPLQNRVVQSHYSPGSIFKIVLAVAGLTEKEISPDDTVYCNGSTRIYNRRFRCWQSRGHGRVNLREAIRRSCDIYFYYLGQKLGIERIAQYSRLFGLGARTGIDFEGERSGLVPDRQWSERVRKGPWYPGETISVAIGQGPLLVTPLQVASLMATVANGGHRVQPHLALGNEKPPPPVPGIDPHALDIVREALWAVVNDKGTGAAARVEGFPVAGKTGTVQVIEQKTWIDSKDLPFEQRDHAWFASYGPTDTPELVVVVFVEHGGKGSEEAAPLARQLYERYYRTRFDARSAS